MNVETTIRCGTQGIHRLCASASAHVKTSTAELASIGLSWTGLSSMGVSWRSRARRARFGDRVVLLGSLRREAVRLGIRGRLVARTRGPACLWLRGESGRTVRVLCLGAGGTYTFVTECGRLVGVADEIGEAARSLVWLVDPQVGLDPEVGR